MKEQRFSVWTATYNRANYLPRLYESLKNQTFKDFEWIIVDDGSTDNTEEIISSFINENKLKSIKYYKKENGGKHTAWKYVTEIFNAPYVITIDSDDILLPKAISIFNKYWEQLEGTKEYELFWEVKGRCQTEEGKLIGEALPDIIFDSSTDEMAFKHRYKKEMHACRKSHVLKNEAKVPDCFPFEEYCNNFSESIRWSRAGRKYKTRYFDEVVRIYYFDAEDTLTSKTKISEKTLFNSLVQTIFAIEERNKVMLKWDFLAYVKTIIIFYTSCFSLKISPFNLINVRSREKLFIKSLMIPSFFYWMIYKKSNYEGSYSS